MPQFTGVPRKVGKTFKYPISLRKKSENFTEYSQGYLTKIPVQITDFVYVSSLDCFPL